MVKAEFSNNRQLKEWCKDATVFGTEVLEWITKENLWNIWVPETHGGLGFSLGKGLKKLQALAGIDGSLGWTVTLCAGANYFIGNLLPEVARELFGNPVVFGGSGGMFGTAEKEGNSYRLNGTWRYATGAPYLTHFTLNAKVLVEGVEQTLADGSPRFLSFVIPADRVNVIEDWKSMGLKASATYSFEVKDEVVDERYCFCYDQTHLPQAIYRIPFSVFADLTLWVNYLGMAEHLLGEASVTTDTPDLEDLRKVVIAANTAVDQFVEKTEVLSLREETFPKNFIREVHETASKSVRQLSAAIISLYPRLGIKPAEKIIYSTRSLGTILPPPSTRFLLAHNRLVKKYNP